MCKTCSDYKHVCLGYSEPTAHLRSQSDSASRMPAPQIVGNRDSTYQRNTRAVESYSPEPAPVSAPLVRLNPDSSTVSKSSDIKESSLSRDTSARTKESDSLPAGDSPESSKLGSDNLETYSCRCHCINILISPVYSGRTSVSSSNRTHVPYFRYFGPTAIVPGFKQMVWSHHRA